MRVWLELERDKSHVTDSLHVRTCHGKYLVPDMVTGAQHARVWAIAKPMSAM